MFLDIGGVMLTNGWGHESRRSAAEAFNLDFNDMDDRHHLTFVTYEEETHAEEYLNRVVFIRNAFTPDQFQEFMFNQIHSLCRDD